MNIPGADYLIGQYVRWRSLRAGVPTLDEWQPAHTQRILLVLTTGLGDAVFSSAVIDPLRAQFPNASFGLFIREKWQALFAGDPRLHSVIPYAGKYRRYFSTLRALKAFKADLTLVLHANDPDILPMLYLAHAQFIVRIPVQGTRYPFLLANRHRAGDQATLPGVHYVENRLRILESLQVSSLALTTGLNTQPAQVQTAQPHLQPRLVVHNKAPTTPYIVLHANAADSYKSWPRAECATFIQQASTQGWAIVLTGTQADAEKCTALAQASRSQLVTNLAGQLSLAEMIGVIQGAQVVIAPDTGILHLAAALGTPTIGLYAPTQASLVGPRGQAAIKIVQVAQTCTPCTEKQCPYPEPLCMAQIDADSVTQQLMPLLKSPHEMKQA